MTFLHGVETIERTVGTRPIRSVKTAVIGLVGTAPTSLVDPANRTLNTPVLIASQADAAKYFGPEVAGFTIPQALRAIFGYGRGLVVVVNTFNPATHKTNVALADKVLNADGQIVLADVGLTNVVVKDQAGDTTYVLNTDYTVTLEATRSVIARIAGGAIAANATVKVGYDKANPAGVLAADIIGADDPDDGRSGIEALRDSATRFGFTPKILIAPGYSTADSVADALEAMAVALTAGTFIDAPSGTTVTEALAGRQAGGTINFRRTSPRSWLCFPYVEAIDGTGEVVTEPLSQHAAGAMATKDDERGYHWSPSNTELVGVIGLEQLVTFTPGDPTSEANLLNDAGIMTAVNIAGVLRLWGNRSAAYPSNTTPENFINVRRVADVLLESTREALLPFIDRPIDDALIDAITATVNRFIRSLIGRGALVDGSCTFDPAENPPEELGAGHLTLGIEFMPPTPAERITIKSFLNIDLLRAIGAPNTQTT